MKQIGLSILLAVGAFLLFWQIQRQHVNFVTANSAAAKGPQFPGDIRPFKLMIGRALTGYNSGNREVLFADFSKNAQPAPTAETHRALYEDYYKKTFGKFVFGELNLKESSTDPNYALLVWNCDFDKMPGVKLSANFATEDGVPKILQMRIEKDETAKPKK